jgi:protein SCO1
MGPAAKEIIPKLQSYYENRVGFGKRTQPVFEKAWLAINKQPDETINDCCELPGWMSLKKQQPTRQAQKEFLESIFEDQDGNRFTSSDFFTAKPTVVVFFYSRCSNPNKCSLSVTRLAQLQELLKKSGIYDRVNTAAITYDPGYDQSARIKAYGMARGFLFSKNHRMLRSTGGFENLAAYFDNGVNFSGTIVNEHRIELYLLDGRGKIKEAHTQLQWQPEMILDKIKKLTPSRLSSGIRNTGRILSQLLPPFLLAFFPKCPVCWATYLSALGVAGISSIPYSPWLVWVFGGVMLFNLAFLYRRAKRQDRYLPLFLSMAGMLLAVLAWRLQTPLYAWVGMLLVFLGALGNSFMMRPRLKAIH